MTLKQLKGLSRKMIGNIVEGEDFEWEIRSLLLKTVEDMDVVHVTDLMKFGKSKQGFELWGINMTARDGVEVSFGICTQEAWSTTRIILDFEIINLESAEASYGSEKALEKLLFGR